MAEIRVNVMISAKCHVTLFTKFVGLACYKFPEYPDLKGVYFSNYVFVLQVLNTSLAKMYSIVKR
jgi:hypothetical protein